MQLTKRSIQVDRSPMTLKERIYLPGVLGGLKITLGHAVKTLIKGPATTKYPKEERPFSPVFRGLHILNRDEEGREKCTACGLCALACPAEAITMEAAERKLGEESLYREEKYAAKYEINMLRCIFCGYCEEACPKDAIYLSETVMPAAYKRDFFIYKKEDLLITQEQIDARKQKQQASK